MAFLMGVFGCWTLRRTIRVRLGSNPAVPLDGCPVGRQCSRSPDDNSKNSRATRVARENFYAIRVIILTVAGASKSPRQKCFDSRCSIFYNCYNYHELKMVAMGHVWC